MWVTETRWKVKLVHMLYKDQSMRWVSKSLKWPMCQHLQLRHNNSSFYEVTQLNQGIHQLNKCFTLIVKKVPDLIHSLIVL